MKIQKAVIPAAGLAIRFLPATKTIPKEMLPIVDRPTILYSVEEIIRADIPELILIAGRDKTSVEDYFDTSYELEEILDRAGKMDLLNSIRDIRKRIKVISIRQQEALGLGHAVLCAESVIGNEPFALLLSDQIMIGQPEQPSAIAHLTKLYAETGKAVVSVFQVPTGDVSKYGIVDLKEGGTGPWNVISALEKPEPGVTASRWGLTGRYVFDKEIFPCLRAIKPDTFGEYQLTDAMTLLAERHGILATTLVGDRFDARDKLGFLQANVEMAIRHPEVGAAFQEYLRERCARAF